MAIKSMIKNVKAAMGVKTKRSRNGSVKSAPGSKPTPLKTASDFDLSTRTDTTEVMMTMEPSSNLFEQAFFRNELSHLKQNVSIRRVTLQDFVQRYERGDLLALHDILGYKRSWKAIKFQDTVEGESYRRWLFKKDNLRRTLERFCCDESFPIVFEEHIKIDMDDMPGEKIVALLKDLQRDVHVCALSFDGFLNYKDIDMVVKSLAQLITADGRRWRKIIIRCSFDGEEFETFNKKIEAAKKKLKNLSVQHGIPIFMKVC